MPRRSSAQRVRSRPRCKLATAPDADGHEIPGTPMDSQFQRESYKQPVAVVDVLSGHAYPDGASGTSPQDGGCWRLLRLIRPRGYREEVEGHPPINGQRDPGGLFTKYPDKPAVASEMAGGVHGDKMLTAQTLQGLDNGDGAMRGACCCARRSYGTRPTFLEDAGPRCAKRWGWQ